MCNYVGNYVCVLIRALGSVEDGVKKLVIFCSDYHQGGYQQNHQQQQNQQQSWQGYPYQQQYGQQQQQQNPYGQQQSNYGMQQQAVSFISLYMELGTLK